MTILYYLLPLVVLALVVGVSMWGRKRVLASVQNMSPEAARAKINQFYAGTFNLEPGETLLVVWLGEEYQGEASAARQVAGAALNQLASAAVGVSTYVPTVRIALTSHGRVLIAREYSDLGERGNFRQIYAFGPGTQALDANRARPGQVMKPPMANPMGQVAAPEFVQFRAPSAEFYEAWMHAGQTSEGSVVIAFHNVSASLGRAGQPALGYT